MFSEEKKEIIKRLLENERKLYRIHGIVTELDRLITGGEAPDYGSLILDIAGIPKDEDYEKDPNAFVRDFFWDLIFDYSSGAITLNAVLKDLEEASEDKELKEIKLKQDEAKKRG